MVSVKAAATGRVSWGPMVSGLGPLEHPETHVKTTDISKTSTQKSYLLRCTYLPKGGHGLHTHTQRSE